MHQTNENRLDVVRDFTEVKHIGGILLALVAAPIRVARPLQRNTAIAAPGGIQTRIIRNNDGGGRAYDKASPEAGPPEAQGRCGSRPKNDDETYA